MALAFPYELYELNFYRGQTVSQTLVEISDSKDNPNADYVFPNLPSGITFTDGHPPVLGGVASDIGEGYYPYIVTDTNETPTATVYKITVHPTKTALDGLHDAIFFDYPINYRANQLGIVNRTVLKKSPYPNIVEMSDNNYNTKKDGDGGTSIVFIIDITKDGLDLDWNVEENRTMDFSMVESNPITHVFLKSRNANQISVVGTNTFMGATGTDYVNILSTVENYEGRKVSIDTDGYQNFLYKLETPIENKFVEVTVNKVTGADQVEVFEIMLLNERLTLGANDTFTEIQYRLSDRSSIIKKDLAERITKVPGVNQDRWKYDVDYVSLFHAEDIYPKSKRDEDGNIISPRTYEQGYETKYNRLLNFIKDRNSNNFVFSGEYTRYPERVYPATFPNPDMQLSFLSQSKSTGERVGFTVMEL